MNMSELLSTLPVEIQNIIRDDLRDLLREQNKLLLIATITILHDELYAFFHGFKFWTFRYTYGDGRVGEVEWMRNRKKAMVEIKRLLSDDSIIITKVELEVQVAGLEEFGKILEHLKIDQHLKKAPLCESFLFQSDLIVKYN